MNKSNVSQSGNYDKHVGRANSLRRTSRAFTLAGAVCVMYCQGTNALPVAAAAMKEATTVASPIQQAAYVRRTRHHITKCYRELLVGPYRCHRFYRW